MVTMQTNTKGGAYGFLVGMVMIFMAALFYIMLNVVFEGGSSGVGLFDVAENQMNISATSEGYGTIKGIWHLIPVAIAVIGLITMYVSAQYKESQDYAVY
jgi:hypothetical protein